MPTPLEILSKFWGYDHFRPLQEDIINSVLNKNDTLALLPTGGGKSICFQVPAMALDGLCLVVSPLIALMKDQVYQLQKRGIGALAIYSGMNYSEIDSALDEAVYGNFKFLYISPERLRTEIFIERLKKMKVGLLAIDEAHCISKWGYDFRPAYLLISEIKKYIPDVPSIALTATATIEVRSDIIEKLQLKRPNVFVQSFARKNLSYSVFEVEHKESKALDILKKVPGTAIIYTKTRKRTVEVAKFLSQNNISADYYHAGLSLKERSKKQEDWINNQTRVVVSTNAFGMGIDKADVRTVVHLDLCENMEAYYQESGRAGRDNKKAYAVILFNFLDIENLEINLDLKYPEIKFLKKVYQSLCNYYQLAFGSISTQSFDFDLQEFCATFGMNPKITHYAFKLLENQGLIYLSDAYHNPSRLKIIVPSTDYHAFQLKNPTLEYFMKSILRIYGGEIFSNYLVISEREIGQACFFSQVDVVKSLEFLHRLEIIDFIPQKNKAQIGFLTARQDAENLALDFKEIERRKRLDKVSLNSIKKFALSKGKCRMLMIQDYFDEEAIESCGICDNCLKLKKAGISDLKSKEYSLYISQLLPCTFSQLENDSFLKNKQLLVNLLKYKLDVDEWGVDDFGLIFSKS
jgi:ATP-dependent DNA helicase RecQ